MHNSRVRNTGQVVANDLFTQVAKPIIGAAKDRGASARSITAAFMDAMMSIYGEVDVKETTAMLGFIRLLGEEGGSVSSKNAASLYGGPNDCTEEAVRKAARLGHLIAIRDGRDNLHFPVWQFSPRGGILPGMKEVLLILAPRTQVDDLTPLTFFLNPSKRLGGIAPLAALRLGGEKQLAIVKRLALALIE